MCKKASVEQENDDISGTVFQIIIFLCLRNNEKKTCLLCRHGDSVMVKSLNALFASAMTDNIKIT